jgi:hypothetical protein
MRKNKLLSSLKQAISQDHLYNDEELIYMKKELRSIEENIENLRKLTSKGFRK